MKDDCANSIEEKDVVDGTLDNAPGSYHGAVLQFEPGLYYYTSTRNNAFTNRRQKGDILVTDKVLVWMIFFKLYTYITYFINYNKISICFEIVEFVDLYQWKLINLAFKVYIVEVHLSGPHN